MALWKSALFSDIRNKLGKQVVFSMWKGRAYMRSYVVPSNPKTNAQTANRLHMAQLVEFWQSKVVPTPEHVTTWNAAALSDLISGYNRFVKGARGFVISAVTLTHASFSLKVDSTSLPLNEQTLYVLKADGFTVIAANKTTLGVYTSTDFTGWTPAAGDHVLVGDLKVIGLSGAPIPSGFQGGYYGNPLYYVDETTGTIELITLT